jgi:hypothetical protein
MLSKCLVVLWWYMLETGVELCDDAGGEMW